MFPSAALKYNIKTKEDLQTLYEKINVVCTKKLSKTIICLRIVVKKVPKIVQTHSATHYSSAVFYKNA